MQSGLSALLLSIAVIAVFALTVGGIRLVRLGERGRGILMILAAAVLLMNVLIWSWVPAY
jgi:hypothetical protein